MNNTFKSFIQIIISIIAFSILIILNSCKVDATNQFNDTQKVEQILSSFEKEIKSENREMQIGFENKNGEKSSILKFTFDNVKMNLMDSTLVDRSKKIMKGIYEEVKDKKQFDKYEILYNKDPNFKKETSGENFSFSLNKINHSFSKEDLK